MNSTHSPAFAMVEANEAYADCTVMQLRVREWIQEAVCAVAGSHKVTHFGAPRGTSAASGIDYSLWFTVRCTRRRSRPATDIARLPRYGEKHDLSADPK